MTLARLIDLYLAQGLSVAAAYELAVSVNKLRSTKPHLFSIVVGLLGD